MKKLLCAALFTIFAVSPSHAGLPIVWGDNEMIMKIGDYPKIDELKTKTGDYLQPGYCWKQFQLFWVPLWNHNGHYCGYINTNTYSDINKEGLLEIANELNASTAWANAEPKLPFWDSIGGKLVAAGALLFLIFLGVMGKKED